MLIITIIVVVVLVLVIAVLVIVVIVLVIAIVVIMTIDSLIVAVMLKGYPWFGGALCSRVRWHTKARQEGAVCKRHGQRGVALVSGRRESLYIQCGFGPGF